MSTDHAVLNRHLLLQLGERLRALRIARGMTALEMAEKAGISRMTLRAVESGDPRTGIGIYLAVMALLGVNQEMALLGGGTFAPVRSGSAAARSRFLPAPVKLEISADPAKHRLQDLLSLSLHEEAVRLLRKKPELVQLARETLMHWMTTSPASRSLSLWQEWLRILESKTWSKVLAKTALAQQLRQASPLGILVPEEARQRILGQVTELKNGLEFHSPTSDPAGWLGDLKRPEIDDAPGVDKKPRKSRQS